MNHSTANTDRSGPIALAVVLGLCIVLVGLRLGGSTGMGVGLFIALWIGLLVAIARAPEKVASPVDTLAAPAAAPAKVSLPATPIDAPATLADALGTPLHDDEVADLEAAPRAHVA